MRVGTGIQGGSPTTLTSCEVLPVMKPDHTGDTTEMRNSTSMTHNMRGLIQWFTRESQLVGRWHMLCPHGNTQRVSKKHVGINTEREFLMPSLLGIGTTWAHR